MKLFLPIILCCFVLTAGSFSSQAQDYTITTTGNAIVITDISGNGETLTVSESGSNVRFEVSPNTRTYSINGGAITAFTTAADIALTGMNAITINTAAGNDVINMFAFAANLPSLTINGGTGDDQVNFNGDIPFAANANLDVDMQNDDAAPGVDVVFVAANANLILTGTGTATVKVSRSVYISTSGSIETADGNLTIAANQQMVPSGGFFEGVWVSGGVLKISGIGLLEVKGTGGNSGGRGVFVDNAGKIEGGSGTVMVQGTGGAASGNNNYGVYVVGANARIISSGGTVSVTGQGGGTGTSVGNVGVYLQSAGVIAGGTVTVQGTGGAASGNQNEGVWVLGAGSLITSFGGAVSVTGQGGGTGTSKANIGVSVSFAGVITAGRSGTVTVQGTGGAASGNQNNGVYVNGTGSRITSSGGAVSVTGQGGGTGTSPYNDGVYVNAEGEISARGSGTVTVQGTGGAAAGDRNGGVIVNGIGSRITSSGGAVSVTGQGGGTGASGFNLGVFVESAEISARGSGTVTVQGTGGAASGIQNYGVYVSNTFSWITSSGGAVSVTGIEGSGSTGIGFFISSEGTVTTAINGGNISIMASSMVISGLVSTNTSSSVTLKPFSTGVAIDLGSTFNPIGGPLGLTDRELDQVTTGTLIIGSATAGNITVSSAISRTAATNVQLRSGGDITFNQHFNTGGGTLLLAPGNTPAAVKPTFNSLDATASTVSFASDLSIAINGTTHGDGTGSTYTRLTVAGSVDLTGVDLVFSGAYVPVVGNTFTIVDNDGVDAIVNTFTGLGEGATISNFLSSGLNATITYLGGDGNDVVITLVESCIPITTIGAISGPVGVCRGATNQVFTVATVPGASSYQWIIPNGATGSSTTNSITLDFSSTYNLGMIAVKAINGCSATDLSARQVQVYLSKPGQPKYIIGKNLGTCTGNEIYSIPAVGYASGYNWVVPANTTIVSGQGTTRIELSFGSGFVSGNLRVTASNCMGTSTARTLMLRTKPATPAAITGPALVCPGAVGVLFSTAAIANVSYNWVVPAGATITSGQGTAAITVTWGNMAGNVKVSASNICGSSAFRARMVGLLSCSTTITMAQAEQVPANEVNNNLEVKLWPNPARDVLMVTLDEFIPNQQMELTLMQADGKVQQVQRLTPTLKGQQVKMEVSRVAAGYYILLVRQQGIIINRQVVIVR